MTTSMSMRAPRRSVTDVVAAIVALLGDRGALPRTSILQTLRIGSTTLVAALEQAQNAGLVESYRQSGLRGRARVDVVWCLAGQVPVAPAAVSHFRSSEILAGFLQTARARALSGVHA